MISSASQPAPRSRRGPLRQGVLWLLGGLAVWITLVGTVRVVSQSLWPTAGPTEYECRPGAAVLLSSLEAARNRATEHTLNEREALDAFRGDLTPIWAQAPAIRQRCELNRDKLALTAIRSLELLRYAEERSIRLSAVELTHLRRTTPGLVQALAPKLP